MSIRFHKLVQLLIFAASFSMQICYPWQIKIQKTLEIGIANGDPNYVFSDVSDVDIDGKGNIFVLDSKNYRVQVFDKAGRFLRSVGRRGKGPGEFESPQSISVTQAGDLFVLDTKLFRVSVFSSEGQYLSSFRVPVNAADLCVNDLGKVVVITNPFHDSLDLSRAFLFDKGGNKLVEFSKPAFGGKNFFEIGQRNRAKVAFNNQGYTYLAFLFTYRLEKYGPGGELLNVWHAFGEQELPTANVTSHEDKADHTMMEVTFQKTRWAFLSVAVHKNYLLLLSMDRGAPLGPPCARKLNVFSPEVKLIETINLPKCYSVLGTSADNLIVLASDHPDVFPIVEVWKITLP